jgi:hypothetical protein
VVDIAAAGSELTLAEIAPSLFKGINELQADIFQKLLAKFSAAKA